MLDPLSSFPRAARSSSWICLVCQSKSNWQNQRLYSASQRPKDYQAPGPPAPVQPQTEEGDPPGLTRRDRPKKRAAGEPPVLQPLSRPVGVDDAPKLGDNPTKDPRPWSQRRDEYWDKEKHEDRRQRLLRDIRTPYFRDWNRMRYHKGKTFLAPDRPFRAEVAKYFPNMQGYTLASFWGYKDTTSVLRGKVSIVSLVSETWAEWQAQSFIGEKENPDLQILMAELGNRGLQKVHINIEEDFIKAIIVGLCLPYTKRMTKVEDRARSFVVRRGVDVDLKAKIGMTNGKVGHVYLVDEKCRIRWVGNGDASDEERASLVRIARRLVEGAKEDAKDVRRSPTAAMRGKINMADVKPSATMGDTAEQARRPSMTLTE